MKTIYFVRHAKSSWKDGQLNDLDRPLNKRGKHDAPKMANRLREIEQPPLDAIVSSPANRAHSTALYFCDVFGLQPIIEREIYEAGDRDLIYLVQAFSDEWQTVAVFGHNPTMTTIANQFADYIIPNVPTCGILKVEADIEHWQDFDYGTGLLKAFYFPKQWSE